MLQDLAVGPLHFSGRTRMSHRRMRSVPRAQHGLLSELPSESAVLTWPEAVLVTASVLRLRLSRVRIGRGRLCSSGRGNSEHPSEGFCSIPPRMLPPEHVFSMRGAFSYPRGADGPLQRLCRGTVSCQSVVFHNLHSTKLKRRLLNEEIPIYLYRPCYGA